MYWMDWSSFWHGSAFCHLTLVGRLTGELSTDLTGTDENCTTFIGDRCWGCCPCRFHIWTPENCPALETFLAVPLIVVIQQAIFLRFSQIVWSSVCFYIPYIIRRVFLRFPLIFWRFFLIYWSSVFLYVPYTVRNLQVHNVMIPSLMFV